jgi:hypothetical protein
VRAVPGGYKAVVDQKDTGVQGLPLAVHQRGDLDRHPRLCELCRGQDSPWAAIVACDGLVDCLRRLNLTHAQARGDHECEPVCRHE